MSNNQEDILSILKSELKFIEAGGYGFHGKPGSSPTSTMFADSLTCLNYGYPYRIHPCEECPLMEFVPEEDRVSAMPCHHIPLDSAGRTVEVMEDAENQAGMQDAVKAWLRQTISRLESERSS